jgi:hypothetical protein
MSVRKKDKTEDAAGRPSWGSSFLGDPGVKFFCGKREIGERGKDLLSRMQDLCDKGGANDE